MNLLATAIIRLAVTDYFKGNKNKVNQMMSVRMGDKFKRDLVKTYKELGFESSKGMALVELGIIK